MRMPLRYTILCFGVFVAALLHQPTKAAATGWRQYAVLYYDTDYYYVNQEVTNRLPGVHYLCVQMQYQYCIVNTLLQPDSYGRIPIAYGWPTYQHAMFISLTP